MSISVRIIAMSALLAVNTAAFTGSAGAASLRLPVAKSGPVAYHSSYWSRHVWRAPGELIRGVRGASPLTVPFFGSGWYPGPAHYYSPRPICCHSGPDAVISVRY